MLSGIVDCSGAFVKPLSSLRSRSCVAASCLCIAQFIVQLPRFDERNCLLRAFAGVAVSAACSSFHCRSTKFAACGVKKPHVATSCTLGWPAVGTVAFAVMSSCVVTSAFGRTATFAVSIQGRHLSDCTSSVIATKDRTFGSAALGVGACFDLTKQADYAASAVISVQ